MTEDVAIPRRTGSAWKLALRLVVTAAFLIVLGTKAHGAEAAIPSGHHVLTGVLLVLAVVMTFVGIVLSAWRWQAVLRVFDAHIPLYTLTKIYLASIFIGTVLPSTIGGDVLRVARASDEADGPTAFGSVVLERLTGFIVLPLIVVVGLLLRPSLLRHQHVWIALVVAAITLVVLAGILLSAGHPRVAGRYAERENWTRFIGAVHTGVDRVRREPSHAIGVLITALVYQCSVIAVFGLVFRALDFDVPILAVIALIPAVLMIQVLPISISGLGVREGAIAFFFTSFDLNSKQALASGLLWFGALVVVSMLGAPAFIAGRHRQRVP